MEWNYRLNDYGISSGSADLLRTAERNVGKLKSQFSSLNTLSYPQSSRLMDDDYDLWPLSEELQYRETSSSKREELKNTQNEEPPPRRQTLEQIQELINIERKRNHYYEDQDLLMDTELMWTNELAETLDQENKKLEKLIYNSEEERNILHNQLIRAKIEIEKIVNQTESYKAAIAYMENKLRQTIIEGRCAERELEITKFERNYEAQRQARRISELKMKNIYANPLSPTYGTKKEKKSSTPTFMPNQSRLSTPSPLTPHTPAPSTPHTPTPPPLQQKRLKSDSVKNEKSPSNSPRSKSLNTMTSATRNKFSKPSINKKTHEPPKWSLSFKPKGITPKNSSYINNRPGNTKKPSLKEVFPPRALKASLTTAPVDVSVTKLTGKKKSAPVTIGIVENQKDKDISLVITLPVETVTKEIIKTFPSHKYKMFVAATENLKGSSLVLKMNKLIDFSDIIDNINENIQERLGGQRNENQASPPPDTGNVQQSNPQNETVTPESQLEPSNSSEDTEKPLEIEPKPDEQISTMVQPTSIEPEEKSSFNDIEKDLAPNSSLISLRKQSDGSDNTVGTYESASSIMSENVNVPPEEPREGGEMFTQIIDSVNRKLLDQKFGIYDKMPLDEIEVIRARLTRMQEHMEIVKTEIRSKGINLDSV